MKQASTTRRHEVEEAGILLKEPPPFREEQGEAIERHLLVVGLYLSEVGVRRQIQRELRGEGIARIHADFSIDIRSDERRVSTSGQQVRGEVERLPTGHAAQHHVLRRRWPAEWELRVN